MIASSRVDTVSVGTTALSAGQTAVGDQRVGYAPPMEILVIVALIAVVAVVLAYRKRTPKPPDEPEATGNDPK
ncbi:hypothetical protein ACWF82_33415 [Nocardia sp. NPDC055053]